MICNDAHDWNAHQRAVMVKEWLDAGEHLTMAEIARRLGMSFNGAKKIVLAISITQPYTVIDGQWQRMSRDSLSLHPECNRP